MSFLVCAYVSRSHHRLSGRQVAGLLDVPHEAALLHRLQSAEADVNLTGRDIETSGSRELLRGN